MEDTAHYLGKGIYGMVEASRLLRRPVARVRRWANGYTYNRTYDVGHRPPVLQTERNDKAALTFAELVELFFVREYSSAGVKIQEIRATAEALKEEYGEHPFARKPLLTDGKRLIAVSEHGFISPSTSQLVADFAAMFVRELEFADDFARLWRPKEGEAEIVIDPARALGEPIIEVTGTPTRTVFATFLLEQDFVRVADYYDLTPTQVRKAIEFELRFADAA